MKRPPSVSEIEFENTTREWIIKKVGLSGFYEISRLKRLEEEGISFDKYMISAEFATIISLLRQDNDLFRVPVKDRVNFPVHLHRHKQMATIKLEGEHSLVFEGESARRLSKYSKLFKIFPNSAKLDDFDTSVFSSLYDLVKRSSGGHLGPMLFYLLEGESQLKHKVFVYLLTDKSHSLAKGASKALLDSTIPKRIFVKSGKELIEKDPLLASAGVFRVKWLHITHSGVVVSKA